MNFSGIPSSPCCSRSSSVKSTNSKNSQQQISMISNVHNNVPRKRTRKKNAETQKDFKEIERSDTHSELEQLEDSTTDSRLKTILYDDSSDNESILNEISMLSEESNVIDTVTICAEANRKIDELTDTIKALALKMNSDPDSDDAAHEEWVDYKMLLGGIRPDVDHMEKAKEMFYSLKADLRSLQDIVQKHQLPSKPSTQKRRHRRGQRRARLMQEKRIQACSSSCISK